MKNFFIGLLFAVAGFAAETNPPAPLLKMSGNGATVVDLPKGWPLFVNGTLFHSARLSISPTVAPLLIDPPNGVTWAEAIELHVTGADGAAQNWNFKSAGRAETRTLQLGQRDFVPFGWRLAPSDTATLAVGEYRLVARLAIQGSSGWNGEAVSPGLTIKIVDPPAVLGETLGVEKAVLNSRYQLAETNLLAAAAILDDFLFGFPTNTRALMMKSRVLEAQGNLVEAWQVSQNALSIAYKADPFPKEPPFSLVLREQELGRALSVPRLAGAWTGGALKLTLNGDLNASYAIETSTTLTNWNQVQTITLTNSSVVFSPPPQDGVGHIFYRARRSP